MEAPDLLAEMDAAGVDMVGLIASVATEGVGGPVDPIHVDEVKEVLDAARAALSDGVGSSHADNGTLRYIEYGFGSCASRASTVSALVRYPDR